MTLNRLIKMTVSSTVLLGAIALSGCASHGSRYADGGNASCANGQAAATASYSEAYAGCGFYWAERWIAVPTYNTIKTVELEKEVIKEVVKEVIVEKPVYIEKEVFVEVPAPQPPILRYPPTTDYTPPPLPQRK